jgi:DNA-binding CsgD family transcriptional regulator
LSSASQSSIVVAEQLLSKYSSKPLESTPPPLVVATPAKIPDETTSITNRSIRPSKIELAATLREIRHLLAEGYTNREIIETLQLEERTFYRYMARIYEQDKAYFEKQDNEAIATEIRLAKERTLKSLRRYDAIAADESLSAVERMEAERLRGDIVIALVKIEIEGPRIVYDTLRRFNGQLQAKQKLELNNIDSRV